MIFKYKEISILFLFSLMVINSSAQELERLYAEGEIPREFTTSSTKKYSSKVKQLDKPRKSKRSKKLSGSEKREIKEKKRFYLESSFAIDDLLQSGYVIFNDTISNYLNAVLDQLPIDNELSSKNPRIYVLNSDAVNAFATEQGVIFVTLGLLARLENEAQLAFILSHELVHIEENHGVETFLNTQEINRKKRDSNFRRVGIEQKMFEKSIYSKNIEKEADEKGFELFSESGYQSKGLEEVFRILYYANLPYRNEIIDPSFFNSQNFKIPNSYFNTEKNNIKPFLGMAYESEFRTDSTILSADTVQGKIELDSETIAPVKAKEVTKLETSQEKSDIEIELDDNEDDHGHSHDDDNKYGTHPSAEERYKIFTENYKDKVKEGALFLVGESQFEHVKKIARYQIPFLSLEKHDYWSAIYNAYITLIDHPEDIELKKVIAKSLYYLSKFKNEYENNIEVEFIIDNEDQTNENDLLGELFDIYYFIDKLTNEETTIIAARYAFMVSKDFPGDKELKTILDDLFVELLENEINENFFISNSADSSAKNNETIEESDSSSTEKQLGKFWHSAFEDYAEDKRIRVMYDDAEKEVEKREERRAYYESDAGKKAYRKRLKNESEKGKNLELENIVVINPFYINLNDAKKNKMQFIKSEEGQEFVRNSMKSIARQNRFKAKILDVTALRKKDIEKFNEITDLNKYINQQMVFYDLSLTPGINQNRINEIADKYDTEYFLWTGIISFKRAFTPRDFFGSIIWPPRIPKMFNKMVNGVNEMMFYSIVFDVKTGRRNVVKSEYIIDTESKSLIKSHIYDTFNQILEQK